MNNDIKKMICPACGASLEIQGHSFTAKCPYCDTVTKVTPDGLEKEEVISDIRMRELEQKHKMSLEDDNKFILKMGGLMVFFIILYILLKVFNIE